MKQWIYPESVTVPDDLQNAVSGHPVVAETLYRRGVVTVAGAQQFMYWHHYRPASPNDLPDMDRAVERVKRAIRDRELICIWGDFDVDGQTSTALLVSALKVMGASVISYIPQRLKEGHGMLVDAVKRVIDGGVSLILTCDTGVTEHEAINYANTCDVDVVITDHHKLPKILPDAFATVNPRRTPPGHPLRDLPGVGVAYKLIEALAPNGYDLTPLLDLVALGIVADVAVQRGDTRYLLQRGLATLANTQRLGLQVMMDYAEVNPVDVNEDDIAFRLAPRLNAIGRLGDANPTTELLTTRSLERARLLANQLEGLNAERQRLSEEVWQGVQAALDREPYLLKHAALVVGHPTWHTGVVGIVANKCVERYDRPALLLATPPDGLARGSARSVAGVDITEAIAANADILEGYGGHTMAAGGTLKHKDIDAFRRGLSEQVMAQRSQADLTPTLTVDREMKLTELDMALVDDVARIAPFGAGNPPLVFTTRGLTIKNQRQLGRDGKHQKLTVEDDLGNLQTVVWWNADTLPTGRFDLAYTVRKNTFRGNTEVLVEWLDYQQTELASDTAAPLDFELIDHRATADPLATLHEIQFQESNGLVIWSEVISLNHAESAHRLALSPCDALTVWTVPPSGIAWRDVLDTVKAKRVYLFANDPGMDNAQSFLARLGGAAKHVLNTRGGQVELAELAAVTAQRESAVHLGLLWFAARGDLGVKVHSDDLVELSPHNEQKTPLASVHLERLRLVLAESAAYRAYWQRAAPDQLKK